MRFILLLSLNLAIGLACADVYAQSYYDGYQGQYRPPEIRHDYDIRDIPQYQPILPGVTGMQPQRGFVSQIPAYGSNYEIAERTAWYPQTQPKSPTSTAFSPTPDRNSGIPEGFSRPVGYRRPILREFDRYAAGFKDFYSVDTGLNFGSALLMCGVLANTSLDRKFQDWYGDNVSCSFTEDIADFSKVFGDGRIFVPLAVVASLTYRWADGRYEIDSPFVHKSGTFFSRTCRAYGVGAPALLLGQFMLGAGRPGDRAWHSQWKPFKDANSISGHGFIGAIPFLTAAEMTDCWWLKGVLYLGSTMTAWGRVEDDAHYLSQSILGWYLAYLTVRSISRTEEKFLPRGLTIFPLTQPDNLGLGVHYTW